MKTKVLVVLALLGGIAASAQAAGTIIGSKHDLSGAAAANSVSITGTNQTCVFCHAPHNALVNKLLWNRKNTLVGTSFNIYTSYNSANMRTALIGRTTLSDGSTSLLCLSCHSLATTAGLVTNTNIAAPVDGSDAAAKARWAATTGNMGNLSNDHPVGINYVTAAGAPNATLEAPTGVASVKVAAVRLFSNSVTGDGTMECASCHSVHDNTNGKFLAISNASSALCKNCHIK